MKKKIILDCDDVLYSCNEYALQLLNQKRRTHLSLSDISAWGLLGNTLDERLEYFQQPEFVKQQPLYPKAKEFVSLLCRHFDVTIATTVPKHCARARMQRIRNDFPMVKNIVIGDKSGLEADYMLDDNIHHLNVSMADHPVLMSRPWNTSNKTYPSVRTYIGFLGLIR